jgi:uncharacterized hydrophobic protein (TIGR00271 family)
MTILSCVIASFGLILDSAAVIIGAMLIAPLMLPILRCSVSLMYSDLKRTGRALGTLFIGAFLSIILSAILGQLVSMGSYNFLASLPGEVLSRTRPNLFDMIVALGGGAAAAYALSRPKLSAAIAGVAISTALMPPLCTVGIGLSQESLTVSGGALLLFTVNLIAIVFASSVTFAIVGMRPPFRKEHIWHYSSTLLLQIVLIIIIGSTLIGTMIGIIKETQETNTIRTILIDELDNIGSSTLVSFDRYEKEELLEVNATIRTSQEITTREAERIQRTLGEELGKSVALNLEIIQITSPKPFVAPTDPPIIPTKPTPTATVTVTPSPTLTATPSPIPTTPITPSPTVTTTAAPSPTATDTSYAIIGATGGHGTLFTRQPGMTPSIAVLPEGLLVELTDKRVRVGSSYWREVVLPDGRIGWVQENHLVPYREFEVPYR